MFISACKLANSVVQNRGLGLWCSPPISSIFRLNRGYIRLVLLVEETGVPGENHRPAASQ
jgi:hypothetical protein